MKNKIINLIHMVLNLILILFSSGLYLMDNKYRYDFIKDYSIVGILSIASSIAIILCPFQAMRYSNNKRNPIYLIGLFLNLYVIVAPMILLILFMFLLNIFDPAIINRSIFAK